MAEPSRAEIEIVAIALYESDCRSYNKGRSAYSSSNLAYQENQVRAAVVATASCAPWAELDQQERARWRKEAQDMLEEAHPLEEVDDGYRY